MVCDYMENVIYVVASVLQHELLTSPKRRDTIMKITNSMLTYCHDVNTIVKMYN